MKIINPIIILIFILSGCKREYPEDPLKNFSSVQKITAKTIKLDHELHGIPGWSMVYDYPLIVVGEGTNMFNKHFFLINLEDKTLIKFINQGRGNCEFENSYASSINSKKRTFTFFDVNEKAYYKVNIDSLLLAKKSYDYCPKKINISNISSEKTRFFVDLKPIDERYFLGYMGELTDSMYTIIDIKEDTFYNALSIPELPEISKNEIVAGKRLFRGNIYIAPNKIKIALISQPTLIEILDWRKGKLSRKKRIEFYRYKFRIDHRYNSITRSDFNNKDGFLIGDVTNNYIYVGYSGHTEEEMFKAGIYPSVYYVLVFDWNGNPVKCYSLNRTIIGMVVEDDDSGMYGISLGSPEIMSIDLVYYKFNHKK